MGRVFYSEEFRVEAVKQVTKNGYSVLETAQRLGVHSDTLRTWIKRLESPQAKQKHQILDSSISFFKKILVKNQKTHTRTQEQM